MTIRYKATRYHGKEAFLALRFKVVKWDLYIKIGGFLSWLSNTMALSFHVVFRNNVQEMRHLNT